MNSINKNSDKLIRLPHGVSDFKKLILGNYKFVDKTLLIKDIINDGAEVIVITRPRRFGKTLNLSMLYYFLKLKSNKEEENENLFKDLKISKEQDFCKKHQNQYPIIFISFKDVKQTNYDKAYEDIVRLIRKLYEEHRYLLAGDILSENEKNIYNALLNEKGDEKDLTGSIEDLSLYMQKKFKKNPIILIDEYDTPIQEAYLKGYYEQMIELIRGILGKSLKDNDYLDKAVVTGITRVAQESLFSGVNNLEVYSLLREEYGQYFGFTEDEVKKLILETKQTIPVDEIKQWYNGYIIGKHVLYNPWSIISCVKNKGKLKPYWLNTSSNALIEKLLSKASLSVRQTLEELLQGKSIERPLSENLVFPDIEKKGEALWSLLLYAGYLKALSSGLQGRRFMAKIAIPNKEVSFVYDEIIEQWFSAAISLESYDNFVQSLHNADLEKFKTYLSSYMMQTGSYFDFNENTPEQVFHVFILGLVVGLRDHYYIYSNRESGLGRFDVAFMPKDKKKKGILLEFKTADCAKELQDNAKESLKQIKDKEYLEEFKTKNISLVLVIGLAFHKKQVELVYENIVLKEN